MALKTRKPTGRVSPPLILIEGGEKVGKSIIAAMLTASKKVGQTFWFQFGEVTADEYILVPGADYEIVVHDGSYAAMYGAVSEIRKLAGQAKENNDPPVVLVIDQMGAEWDLLRGWANNRARGSRSNRKKLEADPYAEIVVSSNYWNDANERHGKLMRLLMTFPGVVVMIARGKEVAAIGADGQPVEGKKTYRVEGHKNLGFDSSCWVRLSRDEPGYIIGARSVFNGVRPGIDPPRKLPDDWTLEWLIFEWLKFDFAKSGVPDLVQPKPERTPEQIVDEALRADTSFERVRELYGEAKDLGYLEMVMPNERAQEEQVGHQLIRIGNVRLKAGPATQEQHKHMHALWREAADFEDREARLKFTVEILDRPVESSAELTGAEADKVIARLKRYIEQNTPSQNGQDELAGTGAQQ